MQRRILLIDDSNAIHQLVSSLLGDEQATIHSAFDAETGCSLAVTLQPDLILLDVEMPGIDGYETCRRLKAHSATANIPIVFLTARASTRETVRGLDLGANDYVAKPFKLTELQSRVRAVLRTGQMLRTLEEKAMVDPLTGLGTFEMFQKRFKAETALHGQPLSCIMLDVDYLNDINEDYGHPFGDFVLSRIGKVLSEICRGEDVACRYSGQAFVVLAPHTTAEEALLLANRMRVAISTVRFATHCDSIRVTCSFGVAESMGSDDTSVLERVEQALCHAKRAGRDRIMTAPTRNRPGAEAA